MNFVKNIRNILKLIKKHPLQVLLQQQPGILHRTLLQLQIHVGRVAANEGMDAFGAAVKPGDQLGQRGQAEFAAGDGHQGGGQQPLEDFHHLRFFYLK